MFAIAQKDGRDIAKGKQIVGVAGRKVKEIKTRPTVRNAPWPFPDEGWVSVATDGSLKEGEAGLGAVIRDHTGVVLASLHRFVPHCSDALVAEAEAALGGLKLAVDVTNLPLFFQLYCEVLVQALNSNAMSRSSIGFILSELRQFVLGDRELLVKKISRTQNRVADLLANFVREV